jgi:DNA primase
MQYHHMDFKTALRYLGGESQIGPVRKKVPPQTLPPEPSKPIDHEALEDITRRAEAKLWSGDGRGLDYLKQRGLADEVIRQARLGYIPPDRPAYWVHGLKVFPGILIPSTYQGRVEFLQFRHIWARGKGDRYRSLGGAGGTLFLGDQLRPFEAIHLFEGAFNALIAQQLGANAAALSSAANTLAPRWYAKFATAPKVYLCGDADVAGQTFMEKHRALGPEFQAWLAPEMDLNALYLQSPQEARAVLGRADYRAQMAALREILFRP